MPESSPVLFWPALLLMFSGAGFALAGVWVASPHRPLPWSRKAPPHERRHQRRDRGRRDRPRRDPRGQRRQHATPAPNPIPQTPPPQVESRRQRVGWPLRRPLR